MKFLIDNALSPEVASHLQTAGHDAIHVRDIGMAAEKDEVIFLRAASDERVIVSADTDFGTLLALRHESKPSVILFRGATPRRPVDQSVVLLGELHRMIDDLEAGAIIIIEPSRLRIRSLPISNPTGCP